jgi:probable non-F420 flavinoid oxidoreductase
MTIVGYHASHEQFAPSELLTCVEHAEQAGFGAAMCSDHLSPWLTSQRGGVGFAYAWLGAALHATRLPFGVVSAPGQRYHPVVLAQAAMTLAEMFPDRFWLAVGSGEASNEHVTGDFWPDKPTRQARLLECVQVMRALWRGETVNHDGLVRVRNGRVYSTAARPPDLVAAAVSAETARWAGSWADALITVSRPIEELRRVVEAFREGGGEGKPVTVQHHLSWAVTDEEAAANAHDQWRHAALSNDLLWELELPEYFDGATRTARLEDLAAAVPSSADPGFHADRIAALAELGPARVMLHNVGRNQREFIDVFGAKVLPAL